MDPSPYNWNIAVVMGSIHRAMGTGSCHCPMNASGRLIPSLSVTCSHAVRARPPSRTDPGSDEGIVPVARTGVIAEWDLPDDRMTRIVTRIVTSVVTRMDAATATTQVRYRTIGHRGWPVLTGAPSGGRPSRGSVSEETRLTDRMTLGRCIGCYRGSCVQGTGTQSGVVAVCHVRVSM
jgi:hypothetical protein